TPATPPDPSRVVTSSGTSRLPRPAPAPEAPAARRAAPEGPARRPGGPAGPGGAAPGGPAAPGTPPAAGGPAGPGGQAPAGPGARRPSPPRPSPDMVPRGASGKPIPPPPGPPRGMSGRPIPPPPGLGGRGPVAARPSRPGGPSRPAGPGRPGGPGGRPGGPMGGPPPGGGPGGGPGGRPGGPAGRRPPRRKGRRRRNREELRPMDMPEYTPAEAPVPEGEIVIERGSTPQDIGPRLNRTAADVVRFLMAEGEMVTATQSLTDDMIELFAVDVGADVRLVDPGEEQEVELRKKLGVAELEGEGDEDPDAEPRPPVITVMGHVDHGKTKLLDQIRNANVVAGEAGGITQHIGAYQVERDGRLITFIDTPGHEAFGAMRARGANATDIVVLVVAADDGVMPQTLEALDHARAADVPIVVAINKIDRENADPQKVMSQLAERELVPESWGGDTIMVEVSALQNLGIDELLDQLLVVADVEELTANPDGRATGVVLESHLDVGRGAVASLLVQRGILKVGDPLVAGAAWGRVRALIDDKGNNVKSAGPSTPVEVLGLSDVASAGDDFVVAPDDKTARSVADQREHYQRVASISGTAAVATGGMKLEDIFSQIQAGEAATLNLIVKADVNGSLEAVTESLKKLERDDVKLAFARRGVGGITKDDIGLAVATNATIIGFNVRPDRLARELAAQEGVEIRSYEIIYKLIEDIESAMVGMLAPEFEEVVTGEAEVR
ncbi:MAG: translation initiation factor IF-2, partial [Acidimicrobiales bacterium]|nr:translation initiation factor IF-2 [Acidimicrobiales bacterium]